MFYDNNYAQTITVAPAFDPPACPTPARRRMMASCLRRLLAACLCAAGLLAGSAQAGDAMAVSPAPERSVKAAFLYKFLGYTEFPPSAFGDAAAPFVIGVADADDLAAELGRVVSGRSVNNRALVVKTLREGEPVAGVHLLFVGGSDGARVARLLKAAVPAPMLVVSEAADGLQQGSVINFKLVEERVRFDVSLEAADKNNVKLSSRLLTVANHVTRGAP
jgi:hypothetical protein